jgi:ubiquinone/menaquinone biosynthesis C-methylase UbiE
MWRDETEYKRAGKGEQDWQQENPVWHHGSTGDFRNILSHKRRANKRNELTHLLIAHILCASFVFLQENLMDELRIKQALSSLYDAGAPQYERAVVPVYRPIAKRMLQLIDLRPGWQVLDAGTGTGLVALLGAPRVGKNGKIIGVDASEQMLKIARHKAAQYGFAQCEFRVGDLEGLDLADGQFNAVLSQFALHYTVLSKCLQEFRRVLMPGGTVVVQEWANALNQPNKVAFDVLTKYRPADAREQVAVVRFQSERAYNFRVNAANPNTMMGLFQAAGFSSVEARIETHAASVANIDAFIDLVTASPTLRAEMEGLSEEVRKAFLEETREALGKFAALNGFAWTYSVLVVIAHNQA